MWDGLFNEFVKYGNEIFVINTAFFNTYNSNKVQNKKINVRILKQVKEFNPEIIITFNHRIPKCILENFLDVPTIIYDGDELGYFCDLDYIKENIKRYQIFSIVKSWEKDYLEFGFSKNQIHYMPIATSINSLSIPQNVNISFLGSIHYNSGKIIKLINSHEQEYTLPKILEEHLNTPTYNYEQLFKKYMKNSYEELNLVEKDLHPFFDYRIITLINLLDLGLVINGLRWEIATPTIPQLCAVHNSKLIWTKEENEKYFNSSKISINPIHPQAKGSGFSWRVFDIMASNACLVCEYSSDLKELSKNYVDIPMYKTPWEARDICKYLLKDEKARKEITLASQKYIEENARWVHRFKEMEQILNLKLINLDKKGTMINFKDDPIINSKNLKHLAINGRLNNLKLKDKIRYKIWKHYNKMLKRKGLI